MARRKKKDVVKEFLTEDLTKRLRILMGNRRKLLLPFPVAADEIYRLAWTNEERAAIGALWHRGSKLFQTSRVILITDCLNDGKRYRISVKLPEEVPCNNTYNTRVEWSMIPMQLAHPIAEWLPQWIQHKDELDRLQTKIEQVAGVCRTYGQVHRIWPDLLGFFDERGRKLVDSARSASRYPDGALVWERTEGGRWVSRGLKLEFQPEAFTEFTSMIAECLMLPLAEDMEEIGAVELVG